MTQCLLYDYLSQLWSFTQFHYGKIASEYLGQSLSRISIVMSLIVYVKANWNIYTKIPDPKKSECLFGKLFW